MFFSYATFIHYLVKCSNTPQSCDSCQRSMSYINVKSMQFLFQTLILSSSPHALRRILGVCRQKSRVDFAIWHVDCCSHNSGCWLCCPPAMSCVSAMSPIKLIGNLHGIQAFFHGAAEYQVVNLSIFVFVDWNTDFGTQPETQSAQIKIAPHTGKPCFE